MPVTDSLRRGERAPSVAGGAVAPVAATVGLAAVVCLLTGVRVWELLIFAAYQVLFVVAPGVLLLRALIPEPLSRATLVAIGWPLGLALELGWFCAAAALGARWLFAVYPLIVLAACGPLAWRRRSDVVGDEPGVPRLALWASAAATAAAIVLLAMLGFTTNALPRDVPSVVPYVDNVFDVAVAAEARHHWPIENPNVSGEPLRYHVLAFVDAAAVNQITGIELDVIVFRLQAMVLLLLLAFQVGWLAVCVAPRLSWAVPGAVAIALLANELDLDAARDNPFTGFFFFSLPFSPTFAFGLPFFIAAAGVVLYLLASRERPVAASWPVLAVLAACAMGAKASTVPVLIVGLGAFVAARLLLDRAIDRRALSAAILMVGVFALVYVALFRGGDSGTSVDPFSWVRYTVVSGAMHNPLAGAVAVVVATAGLLAPWVGAVLLVGRVDGIERTAALWLGALAVGAIVPFMALGAAGDAQGYFVQYGTPVAAVLSAWGIARAWPAIAVLRIRPVAALSALAVLALVAIAVAKGAGAIAPYVVVAVALAAAGVAVLRRRGLAAALPVVVVGLVALTLVDVPLDVAPSWARDVVQGTPHHVADAPAGPRGIDTQMLTGLRWLRGHSNPDDVLAVDVQSLSTGIDARYFVYAAYAERRTFLGGWAYATDAVSLTPAEGERLFATRQRLNDAAFAGDRRAIGTLRARYGVRWLVVDLRHGAPRPALDRVLRRAYANPALRIYRV